MAAWWQAAGSPSAPGDGLWAVYDYTSRGQHGADPSFNPGERHARRSRRPRFQANPSADAEAAEGPEQARSAQTTSPSPFKAAAQSTLAQVVRRRTGRRINAVAPADRAGERISAERMSAQTHGINAARA